MVGTPSVAQRRAVSTQIRLGPMRRTAPALRKTAATSAAGRSAGSARIPKRRPAPDGSQTGVSRTGPDGVSRTTGRSMVTMGRRSGAATSTPAAARRVDEGAAASQASTVSKTVVGWFVALRMLGHRRPPRTVAVGHVDARAAQAGREGRVGGDAIGVEDQRPRDGGEAECRGVGRLDGRQRVGGQDEPVDLEPAVRKDLRLGCAVEAVARALHAGEGSLLPNELPAAAGRRPQDEVVDDRAGIDRAEGDEATEPEADDGRPLDTGSSGEPADRAGHCVDPGGESIRIGGGARAVTGAGEVEPQGGTAAGRQPVRPRAARTVRGDVGPAPRRQEQHRCAGRPGVGCLVQDPEARAAEPVEIDGGSGHGAHVALVMGIARRPLSESAVSQPAAPDGGWSSPGTTVPVGRRLMWRSPPGSIVNASSAGT